MRCRFAKVSQRIILVSMNEQRSTIVRLNAFLIALTLTATGSRIWWRMFVVRNFSLQDGLITLACVAAIIFSACQITASRYGLGEHMVDMDTALWPTLIKILMASNIFYFLCNWAVKHALLLFYLELTCTHYRIRLIYFMHFVAFGFGLSSILVNLFLCRPLRKNWMTDVNGRCFNRDAFYYANAGIMLATDCVLYAMPLVFTAGLQLRKKQKWGLRILFGLGGLVLAASAARVYSTHLFATKPDYTYRFANIMLWAEIENHLAVVVACAPSIKVVVLLVFPRLVSVPKILSHFTFSRSPHSAPVDVGAAEVVDDDDAEGRWSKSPRGQPGSQRVNVGMDCRGQ